LPARLREIQDTSSTIIRRGGSTGRAGLFDGKGCAINSNMAYCPAKVYIFLNKNSSITVIIFYNDFNLQFLDEFLKFSFIERLPASFHKAVA